MSWLRKLPWALFWSVSVAWFSLTIGYYKGFAAGAREMRAAVMCSLGSAGAVNADDLHKWCNK